MAQDIEVYLNSLGWSPANGKFLETLRRDRPRIAFLAPPLETIPNPSGNAIYCLVECLVERLGASTVAMAIGPGSDSAQKTPIRDRLLYYHRSLKPSLLFRLLPYRVKKLVFGTSAPELR